MLVSATSSTDHRQNDSTAVGMCHDADMSSRIGPNEVLPDIATVFLRAGTSLAEQRCIRSPVETFTYANGTRSCTTKHATTCCIVQIRVGHDDSIASRSSSSNVFELRTDEQTLVDDQSNQTRSRTTMAHKRLSITFVTIGQRARHPSRG